MTSMPADSSARATLAESPCASALLRAAISPTRCGLAILAAAAGAGCFSAEVLMDMPPSVPAGLSSPASDTFRRRERLAVGRGEPDGGYLRAMTRRLLRAARPHEFGGESCVYRL